MNEDNKITFETEVFICDCNSMEHQCKFWHDETEFSDGSKWDELYLIPHLNTHRNFFQRIIIGVKYIFGHKSDYGAWDDMWFKPEDAEKLRVYLNKLKLKKE